MELRIEINDSEIQKQAKHIVDDMFALKNYGDSRLGVKLIETCVIEVIESEEFMQSLRKCIQETAMTIRDSAVHSVVDVYLKKRIKKIIAKEDAAGTLFEDLAT